MEGIATDTHVGYRFIFPARSAQSEPPPMDSQNFLLVIMEEHTILLLNREFSMTLAETHRIE